MKEEINKAVKAIEKNGYAVDKSRDICLYKNSFAVLGRIPVNDTKDKREKLLLYTNGSEYTKGYMTGLLAEPMVKKMTVDYVDNVIWDFISSGDYQTKWWKNILGKFLAVLVYLFSLRMKFDIPKRFKKELKGIYNGCKSVNRKTRVRKWRLWVLNTGVDTILSMFYSGRLGFFRLFKWHRKFKLRIPVMCQGISLGGNLTEHGDTLFGRNFMFPTSNVFQLYVAQIVHEQITDGERICFTGIGAPGFAGLMTGMNEHGLGVGVNMIAGNNCSPRRPGLNSLLMVRLCTDSAKNTEGAVQLIENTRRGVSWLYVIADHKNGKSCVVEAGKTARRRRYLSKIPKDYREILPDREFIRNNPSVSFRRGIMVRNSGFRAPEGYYAFNRKLFEYYKQTHPGYKYDYREKDFETHGILNDSWKDKNCPGNRYFAPQREFIDNMLIVTNTYIIPEMRLYAMPSFTNLISQSHQNDFQWRYDMLNKILLDQIKKGKISFKTAREIINFISPESEFAKFNDHYYTDPEKYGRDTHIPVEGSVSILSLKNLYMETITGYYEDDWVKLDLKDFLQ